MTALYTFLFLSFSANPISENEIHRLIDKLGHPDYKVREATSNELGFIGKSAIKILRQRVETASDLEIKWRAQEVIDFYFRQCYQNLLPIWLLPQSYRRLDGRDAAKQYYELARKQLNDVATNRFVKDENYTDYATAVKATSLFLKDLIEGGIDDYDISDLKRQMADFDRIFEHNPDLYYNFHFSGEGYTEDVPEEVEEIIKKINEVGINELITP